jgi:ankyrin repeat protein
MKIILVIVSFVWVAMTGCGAGPGEDVGKFFKKADDADLVRASLAGNSNKVGQILLEGRTSVDCRGYLGRTPLMFATGYGNREAVLLLLNKKADPNLQDDAGYSPISMAARIADPWFLRVMLTNHGNANLRDKYGNTPIFGAASTFLVTNIDILIEAGADPNAQDGLGKTPMMQAANLNGFDVVYYLLKKGADPLLKDNVGHTICYRVQHSRIDPNSPLVQYREKVIDLLKEKGAWRIEEKVNPTSQP